MARSQERLREREGVDSAGEGAKCVVFPTLAGTAKVGETLTGTNGSAVGTYPIVTTRAWTRDDAAITGATNATYVLVEADKGKRVRFRNIFTSDTSVAIGDSTAVVVEGDITLTTPPELAGTAEVGETLTGTNGTFAGSPTITITRAWLRDGEIIESETGATYTLVEADEGCVITFRNIAANSIDSLVVDSEPTEEVAPDPGA